MIFADPAVAVASVIGECECGTCGRTYDFERDRAGYSDQCPDCTAAEEGDARAGEEREEAIIEAQGELVGLMEELRDVRERIAETHRTIRAARRKLARLASAK
jgi:hypothetical protein